MKNERGTIKIAIAGVGNCASSLVQGIAHYAQVEDEAPGLMYAKVGGWGVADIEPVAAFDVDPRKVGRDLSEAIFAAPNCTARFASDLAPSGVTVQMGPVHDGVAQHMASYAEDRAHRVAEIEPVDVAQALRDSGAEVLVCYLPVGSDQAVRAYAEACLKAGVAMVNCVPVFIASHPEWAERFRERGVPIVGDDIKSQFGATIMHRALTRLMADRGVNVRRTYQLNTGGNTDFLNMLDRERLASKKVSKTSSVQSQLDVPLDADDIHVGPSDYVPWQNDNKVCFLRIEWDGFGGVPMHLEARLSVEDSPNSAGVAVEAIRCAKIALDRGQGGPVRAASAYTMKHPPEQLRDEDARLELERFMSEAENNA